MIRAASFDALGFAHGFGLRDDDEAALALALEVQPERLFHVRQVHGRSVAVLGPTDRPADVAPIEADALVSSAADCAVYVVTADCMPILVADRDTGRVAAVHAGWRGVELGVLAAALDALGAGSFVAAIGPHIRVCCFEVGDDVARRLESVGARVDRSRPKPHVDLVTAVARVLGARGVAFEDVGGCTRCEPARFHSYRREGRGAGRQLSGIAVRRNASGGTA